jgi:hypothetical protein
MPHGDTPIVNPTAVKCESSIPGPQKRGTGGTLILVYKGHRDWHHPPLQRGVGAEVTILTIAIIRQGLLLAQAG